jgi:hypothetical protein
VAKFDPNKLKRDMQAIQRKAEADLKRQVAEVKGRNQRIVDDHNRKIMAANKKAVDQGNQRTNARNQEIRRVNTHNARLVGDLQKQLRSTGAGPRYTPSGRYLPIASKSPYPPGTSVNGMRF